MSNGVDEEKCPICPYVVDSFEEDGPAGASKAVMEMHDHFEKGHGLDEEDCDRAVAIAICLKDGGPTALHKEFLNDHGVTDDDYKRLTGHEIWCGDASTCTCGARPDLAEKT